MINFENASEIAKQEKQNREKYLQEHKQERLHEAEEGIIAAIKKREAIALVGGNWAWDERVLCMEELDSLGFVARVRSDWAGYCPIEIELPRW